MDLNSVNLVGRCAQDPTLKLYNKADGTEGARCFFRLAVTRQSDRGQKDRSKRRTNFIGITAWGNLAKVVAQYVKKGTELAIHGELLAEFVQPEGTTDPKLRKEYVNVLATDIQFGRQPGKNAGVGANDMQAQIEALRAMVEKLTGTPIHTEHGTEMPVGEGIEAPASGNPFRPAETQAAA